jgi:hypothetical protein
MVSLIALTDAMVAKLQSIPPLVSLLESGAASIQGYIDENPDRNSLSNAIYQMPSGSLLVVWNGTVLEAPTTMEAWVHVLQIFVRAKRGGSALAVVDELVDGIPEPGDGLRWRYCPLLDGVLPTVVKDVSRVIDEEGIDYFVVTTFTQETGDA